MRSLQTVMFEAIVIGVMNLVFFYSLSMSIKNPMILLFISGALIHIVFEYLGLNEWWCKSTY
jgi:endonuclease V-like protein UPF0215 family